MSFARMIPVEKNATVKHFEIIGTKFSRITCEQIELEVPLSGYFDMDCGYVASGRNTISSHIQACVVSSKVLFVLDGGRSFVE